jgi:hypothetical protein
VCGRRPGAGLRPSASVSGPAGTRFALRARAACSAPGYVAAHDLALAAAHDTRMTSRIPVPASQSPGHSHTYSRSSSHAPASPVPFPPDRAASPLGPQRQNSTVMSTVSGLGMSEGRKKQSKRDEARSSRRKRGRRL